LAEVGLNLTAQKGKGLINQCVTIYQAFLFCFSKLQTFSAATSLLVEIDAAQLRIMIPGCTSFPKRI
tara:strand:+ start:129 stop:329 length:201 start_codon:yes stop_codon:yes gene_type:complete